MKVLGVIGATGQQGGSVVDFVLNDAKLSAEYSIRAITRDPAKATQLQGKVELVEGDSTDENGFATALKGVDVLFAMTPMGPPGFEAETGIKIANAAVAAGVEYIIYSTLPDAEKTSNGKYNVAHFDEKAKVEEHIRSLKIKSSFILPGFFMQNFEGILAPVPKDDGTLALTNVTDGEVKVPLFNVVQDTGNIVAYILNNLDQCEGQVVFGGQGFYSYNEIAEIMSKTSGKVVKYEKVAEKEYLPFLPEPVQAEIVAMMKYFGEFGFGPDAVKRVEQGQKMVMKPLGSFEEYLKSRN